MKRFISATITLMLCAMLGAQIERPQVIYFKGGNKKVCSPGGKGCYTDRDYGILEGSIDIYRGNKLITVISTDGELINMMFTYDSEEFKNTPKDEVSVMVDAIYTGKTVTGKPFVFTISLLNNTVKGICITIGDGEVRYTLYPDYPFGH